MGARKTMHMHICISVASECTLPYAMAGPPGAHQILRSWAQLMPAALARFFFIVMRLARPGLSLGAICPKGSTPAM